MARNLATNLIIFLLGLGLLLTFIEALQCPYIEKVARETCSGTGRSEEGCLGKGCCWDESAEGDDIACYEKECKNGHFGWGCKFECKCPNGEICDKVTGQCPSPCPADSWGVACLLENTCTYNDNNGENYMGKLTTVVNGKECINWRDAGGYGESTFPDKDFDKADRFCRNPTPHYSSTWCYTKRSSSGKEWGSCPLKLCECPKGRYGVNCEKECHCVNPEEDCGATDGVCQESGCHPSWKGPGCQECIENRFGEHCQKQCHCYDSKDICDRQTGDCLSGCAAGWNGTNCQTECADGWFGINCLKECNCKTESEVCDKVDGTCISGCRTGYVGSGCQVACQCKDPSNSCHPDTGACQSCEPGRAGESCDIEVPTLTRKPSVIRRDAKHIRISWRKWRRPPDSGDGLVNRYQIEFRKKTETAWQSSVSEYSALNLKNLEIDTLYVIKVLPIHEMGVTGYAGPDAVLEASTCGNPISGPSKLELRIIRASQSAQDAGGASTVILDITWQDPDNTSIKCDSIKSYRVYTAENTQKLELHSDNVEAKSIRIENVDESKNFTVAVSVVNNADLEGAPKSVMYLPRGPPVENLMVESTSPTSLKMTWIPISNYRKKTDHYIVQYRKLGIINCMSEAGDWSNKIQVSAYNTQKVLTNLDPYSNYETKIWGVYEREDGNVATKEQSTMAKSPEVGVENIVQVALNARSATLRWHAYECEQLMGEFRSYRYILSSSSHGESRFSVVKTETTNVTEVSFQELVPYTVYSLSIAIVNNIGVGNPGRGTQFTTFQDRPPKVSSLDVAYSASNYIIIQWEPPVPPHGVITGYDVIYSFEDNSDPQEYDSSSSVTEFQAKDLEPSTSYKFKVRALTEVGEGPWFEKIGLTKEAAPGRVEGFKNISRSQTSITFEWGEPNPLYGTLLTFKLGCTPADPLGQYLSSHKPPAEIEVDMDVHEREVENLRAGTRYMCTVQARSSAGNGELSDGYFYTYPKDPPPPMVPMLEPTHSTDNSLVVKIGVKDSRAIEKGMYQIVVEKVSSSIKTEETFQKRSVSRPCGMSHTDLVDFRVSKIINVNCYVTAQITELHEEQYFTVGDNKTYGNYYNAPLDEGGEYVVWLGLVITVDGIQAASYTKTEHPALAEKYEAKPTESSMTVIAAAAGVSFLVVILVLVLVIILVVRRRKVEKGSQPLQKLDAEGNRICHRNGSEYSDGKVLVVPVPPIRSNHTSPTHSNGTPPDEVSETVPLMTEAPKKDRKPISTDILWDFVKDKKEGKTDDSFPEEYHELPMGLKLPCEVARKQENKLKNRYANIIAYDHSRVVLECLPDDSDSDYINANYIDGYRKPRKFIATQGPNKNTLNDIWRMAWQENVANIIMVTNLVEDGRHKCDQYWPDQQTKSKTYGDILVETIDIEAYADFTIRIFALTKNDVRKMIHQLHFTSWPDHGVPSHATSLLDFRKKVKHFENPNHPGPMIVHCSAGVGRTGTFVALDYLLDQAKIEGQIDVYNCVKAMRTTRVNMVQTEEQYEFVYDAILEALRSGDTSIPCTEFRERYEMMWHPNADSGATKLDEEYELLELLCPTEPASESVCSDAIEPQNVDKNRTLDIIPMDNTARPFLVTYIPGGTDYINAVFVDAYKCRDGFIISQHPLPNTIVEFWSMLYDHECKTVIMVNPLDDEDESIIKYWPESTTDKIKHGPFTIELVSVDTTNEDFTTRDISITMNKKDADSHTLRQFQFHGWPKGQTLPTKNSVINLLIDVERWQQRSGNGTIAVHCLNGAINSGFLCAVSYLVERLKVEQEVDVFQTVKHIRINRPQLVTKEQYKFLYEMALEYMDCFDTYANFK